MHRRRIPDSAISLAFTVAAVIGVVGGIAGCSDDSASPSPTTQSPSTDAAPTTEVRTDLDATTTTTIGPAELSVRTTSLGDIVVDADGMTLYARVTLPVDRCTATCLDAWPQVRATSVTAGNGVDPTLVVLVDTSGTTTTLEMPSDPAAVTTIAPVQEGVVSFAGHTLHRFVGDVLPGDTTGQGFNATFWVVLGDGTLVQPPPPTTTSTTP